MRRPGAAGGKLGFYSATPVVQPSGVDQAAVTLGNVEGAIGGLTISDPPTQAEVQAGFRSGLRSALNNLSNGIREAVVEVGMVKDVAYDGVVLRLSTVGHVLRGALVAIPIC